MGAEPRINLDGNEERSGGKRPFQPGACVPVVMVVVMIVAVRVRVSVQTVLRNYFIAGHANGGPKTAGDRRCLTLSGDRLRPKSRHSPGKYSGAAVRFIADIRIRLRPFCGSGGVKCVGRLVEKALT